VSGSSDASLPLPRVGRSRAIAARRSAEHCGGAPHGPLPVAWLVRIPTTFKHRRRPGSPFGTPAGPPSPMQSIDYASTGAYCSESCLASACRSCSSSSWWR
jgi:hypothetical protein